MHSDVLIVARPGRSRGSNARAVIAARATEPDTVHLVSTAATPLGGDTIALRVIVEPGARLRVRSAAATVDAARAHHRRVDCALASRGGR